MKVSWTDRAKSRLHKIRDHIAEENEIVANNTVEKILRRSWKIGTLPDIGHKVPGYEDTALKEVLLRPYRIIYINRNDQIDIVSVLHYRQLLPDDLATRAADIRTK